MDMVYCFFLVIAVFGLTWFPRKSCIVFSWNSSPCLYSPAYPHSLTPLFSSTACKTNFLSPVGTLLKVCSSTVAHVSSRISHSCFTEETYEVKCFRSWMSSREISNAWDDPGLFSHPRSGQHFALSGFALLCVVYSSKIKKKYSSYLWIQAANAGSSQHWFMPVRGAGNTKRRGVVIEGRARITTLPSEEKFKFFARATFWQWIYYALDPPFPKQGRKSHPLSHLQQSHRLWECNVLMLPEGWIKLLCKVFQQKWQV